MTNIITQPKGIWQTIASRKRAQRDSKIPPHWTIPASLVPSPETTDVTSFASDSGFFTPRQLELTSCTALEVVTKLASGEWKCEEVTTAVCKRAAVAQQLVNCLTEICFEEAIARAKELDERFARGGPVGALHGLPISVKDQFNLPGVESTLGYVSWIGRPVEEYSTTVKLLMDAGAIVIAKTNIPTTLMKGETGNNVFGQTSNPYNRRLSPGGSSGGEAALIALRGSYLGIGTDIGGSIRGPCEMSGLFGLRPSHGRVSYQNVANTFLGQEAIRSCAGPMARSVEDLRLFMTELIAQKPWLHDLQCLPIPWRNEEEVLPEKMCFGFAFDDGRVSATPPLRRAIERVKRKLEEAGHSCIEFVPREMPEAHDIAYKMWSADGGEEFRRDSNVSGEPLPADIEAWMKVTESSPKPTVFQTWQTQHQRTLLGQRWLERWNSTAANTGTGRPIDGLIFPVHPFPAVRHGSKYSSHFGALSPLLDLTTGSFPVTKVNQELDVVPSGWQPLSEKGREIMDFYGGPQNHENAPIGLSIIGRRLEEEKVVAMLQLVSGIVGIDY